MSAKQRIFYRSLEDFLITKELSVDAELDDGLGAKYPVKGREIEATILFADISLFSQKTLDLSPTATLIYVNRFFTWITNEALKGIPCIVDKYIGDQIMIVFSNEFGSEDHFLEALRAARWFAERDVLGFHPHMGIASGLVTVGYVGTPLRYNCTVFGGPVNLASRCANLKIEDPNYASIILPATPWRYYTLEDLFRNDDEPGEQCNVPPYWKELPVREVSLKGIGPVKIASIIKVQGHEFAYQVDKERALFLADQTRHEADEDLRILLNEGRYKPISK